MTSLQSYASQNTLQEAGSGYHRNVHVLDIVSGFLIFLMSSCHVSWNAAAGSGKLQLPVLKSHPLNVNVIDAVYKDGDVWKSLRSTVLS